MKRQIKSVGLAMLLCVLGSACGGGGDSDSGNPPVGGSPAQPPPPAPPPPAQLVTVPFTAAKRWLYDLEWHNSYGGSMGHFVGERLLYTVGQVTFQGRSAWQVLMLDVNDLAVNEQPFLPATRYLSQTADGLDVWVGTPESGKWKRALGSQQQSFSNSTFLMAGGPNQGSASTTITNAVTVTVPSGTYSTSRTTYRYSDLNGTGTSDVDEAREEYFADGVGLVASIWDYHFDDNDPSASDSSSVGSAKLRAIDAGPDVVTEAEPNNDAGVSAQMLPLDSFVSGITRISDVGRIVNDSRVDANSTGEKRLQDWYCFTVTASGVHSVLLWHLPTTIEGVRPDLDLYLFREGTGGALTFIAKSNFDPTLETGEWIHQPTEPGKYCAAVQAWSTGAPAIPYWLIVR
jgi:hypothetical protein